jgi:hypothetical protein
VEAQQTTNKKPANEGADDTYDQVGQQSVIAAGDALGEPSGENADHDTGQDIHTTTFGGERRKPTCK